MDETQYQQIYKRLFAVFTDPRVDEVLANGLDGLWVIAGGQTIRASSPLACPHSSAFLSPHSSPFSSLDMMLLWLSELARRHGLRLDPVCGSAGGSLEDQGYRWHCVLPPLAQDGPLLSIRRHRFSHLALSNFTADEAQMAALIAAARGRAHLLIVGPTGSGKSTLLATLLRDFAAHERVVLVESLAELPSPSPCSVRLLERQANLEQIGAVSLTRLVHEALRLRPDRLVIGEIRSHEAAAYLEALLSGHMGVMTTLHAINVGDALARLSLLARGAGWTAAPAGWQGVPLVVAVLERGHPPRLAEVAAVSFVPSG